MPPSDDSAAAVVGRVAWVVVFSTVVVAATVSVVVSCVVSAGAVVVTDVFVSTVALSAALPPTASRPEAVIPAAKHAASASVFHGAPPTDPILSESATASARVDAASDDLADHPIPPGLVHDGADPTEEARETTMAKALRMGGFVSGAILITFGVVVIALAINGRSTVTDGLKDEKIVGSADMNPSDIEAAMKEAGLSGVDVPSCDVADEEINTGSEARCFAEYMRIHALEASGGLTYAEMGRFATENGDPKGTNDAEQAAKDDQGQPVSNSARNLWVTETALSTALNVSYMAEQPSLFSLVVGIALLLAGVGFIILAYAALRPPPEGPTSPVTT